MRHAREKDNMPSLCHGKLHGTVSQYCRLSKIHCTPFGRTVLKEHEFFSSELADLNGAAEFKTGVWGMPKRLPGSVDLV